MVEEQKPESQSPPVSSAAASPYVSATPEAQRMTEHTPEERTRMYRELAAQKEEQERARQGEKKVKPTNEDRKAEPPLEREGCGRARWFSRFQLNMCAGACCSATKDGGILDGTKRRTARISRWTLMLGACWAGRIVNLTAFRKYLDTSLIDVEPHPTFVRVFIKGATRYSWTLISFA